MFNRARARWTKIPLDAPSALRWCWAEASFSWTKNSLALAFCFTICTAMACRFIFLAPAFFGPSKGAPTQSSATKKAVCVRRKKMRKILKPVMESSTAVWVLIAALHDYGNFFEFKFELELELHNIFILHNDLRFSSLKLYLTWRLLSCRRRLWSM